MVKSFRLTSWLLSSPQSFINGRSTWLGRHPRQQIPHFLRITKTPTRHKSIRDSSHNATSTFSSQSNSPIPLSSQKPISCNDRSSTLQIVTRTLKSCRSPQSHPLSSLALQHPFNYIPLRYVRQIHHVSSKDKSSESSKPVSSTDRERGMQQPRKLGEEEADKTAFLNRLPELSRFHRPTKEELLAAATGFWSRLRVRFKWFSIRSLRPFNMDDISAFFSWILLGHVIWIVVGTTTFFSLLIFAVNTVFAQETLARWIGNYLTQSSGVKVVFESAIVPKWGDGVITFKNVFVSRRPGTQNTSVTKGSPENAAAAAAAIAAAAEAQGRVTSADLSDGMSEEEAKDYTQFDLSIETINVTLSFTKWFNSKGLLRDVEVRGVRGVIDRSAIEYPAEYIDPRIYRHEHSPGDFEIESFKMEDLLVSVHQPNQFRPYSVSIFTADLPQLRKQWLFYDFLSANHIHGSFDDSLFTIHPRQTHNFSGPKFNQGGVSLEGTRPWKKQSRLRVDNLNIDHLNRGVEGPFSWIREGNVDIIADIMFPADTDESIAKVMTDFYDRMEATVSSTARFQPQQTQPTLVKSSQQAGVARSEAAYQDAASVIARQQHPLMVMDLRIHLNDVRAFVPIFTNDLSYVNNALIRPIVAYINSKKQFLPIHCRVAKKVSEFDGSWTIYDSGLMEDLSEEAYEAFVRDVVDDQARMRRIKKVGLWSLQLAIQALFLGLAGNIA